MVDANLQLKASGAETVSTNGATLDLGTGTPKWGLNARVLTTAVSGTTPSLIVAIQVSTDAVTWYTLAQSIPLNAVGEYSVAFESDYRYVRYASTITGTTPSFTYQVDIQLGRP